MRIRNAVLSAFAAMLLCSVVVAQAPPPPAPKPELPDSVAADMVQVATRVYQLGAVTINMASKLLTVPGRINQLTGPIELLAAAPGGRLHECVLVLDVEPVHLFQALVLLGLECGQNIAVEGDPNKPQGSPVKVEVEWDQAGQKIRYRVEDLALDVLSKQSMPHIYWIFTGSRYENGVFMAQQEKSIITTYRFPYSLLDNPLDSGTNDDEYVANTLLLPPVGTPVRVYFQPGPKEAAAGTEEKQ